MYSVSSHMSCADTYPIPAQYVRHMHNTSSIRVLPSDAVDTARYTVDTQPIRSRYAGCTLSLALCPKLKEPVLLLVTRVWGRLRLTGKGRGRLGRPPSAAELWMGAPGGCLGYAFASPTATRRPLARNASGGHGPQFKFGLLVSLVFDFRHRL